MKLGLMLGYSGAHMRLPVEPTNRVSGIAARLNALLDDPPVDMTASPTGVLRRIAVEHFDWALCATKMEAAYRRFVGRVE